MNYNKELYSTYVSSHTSYLYGEASLNAIKRLFPIWKSYYGKFLPKDKNIRILDIGCGNGGFVYYLKTLGYKNAFGIDVSSEQVEIGKNLGIKEVECADVVDFLKNKKDYYEVLILKDVLEHFAKEHIMEFLSLAFSSMRPEGVLIIQTPNAESPFVCRYRYGDFTHETAFTRSSLNQVLTATGFRKITFYPIYPVPHGVYSFIRFLLWFAIQALLKFYLLVETGSSEGFFTQNIIAIGRKE